jgi:hypothetical protein
MLTRTLAVCLLVAAVGCGQAPSSAPSQPGSNSTGTDAAAISSAESTPAATVVPAGATQIAAQLAELTQAVRKYGVEKRRVPKSLEELVAGGYLNQVPQAPPGKRFEIDQKLQVQLVDE